jgi:diacylglycerol kinase (ATP)
VLFVVNPLAGSGRAARIWDALLARRPDLVASPVVREPAPAAARAAIERALADPAVRAVIAIGGDGTAHLVANVLLASGLGARVAMALVPGGTGSDLAHSLGVPDDPVAAIERALDGTPRPMDALAVRCGDAPLRYVVNSASAGVSGNVVEAVNTLAKRGATTYMLTTIKALFRYTPVRCRVTVDDELFYEGPLFLLAVTNGPTFGKSMRVAPLARLDDGRLDVVLVGDVPRWELLYRLPQLLLGKHLGSRRVRFRQASRVTCEPLSALESFPSYELDGDLGPPSLLQVEVLPGALQTLR